MLHSAIGAMIVAPVRDLEIQPFELHLFLNFPNQFPILEVLLSHLIVVGISD